MSTQSAGGRDELALAVLEKHMGVCVFARGLGCCAAFCPASASIDSTESIVQVWAWWGTYYMGG